MASVQAHYVGSPEHKIRPSFAGHPRPRADASICDPSIDWNQDDLTTHLRESLKAGLVGDPWEGIFPRYVWWKNETTVYEGRLVNKETGEYKGYHLESDEWPEGI